MIKQYLRTIFTASCFKAATLVFVGASILLSASAFAQTRATEHGQNWDASTNQIQAQGTSTDPNKSFVEEYAPPKIISSFGGRIDWLFRYTSWVTFGFFVFMAVVLIYFTVVYRQRPGHKAYYTHGLSSFNKNVTHAFDLLVFLSLDLVLIIASYRDTTQIVWNYPTGPDVIKIMAMPQQWVWNFKYAGNDGIFGTADDVDTINDLRVPKDKKILMQMKSKDVIHGFMIPNVRLQVDVIPGVVTKIWFDANENGDYEIACYHLCGTGHYKMKAFLKVIDDVDYQAWVKESSDWAKAKFDPEDTSTQWGWSWGPDEPKIAKENAR